jgi:ribosome-binding protein aMBF1 (putative translation factor)
LAALSPEKRAKAEAALARIQSPEYQAKQRSARKVLDREYRTTGTISFTPADEADAGAFQAFIRSLRAARESAGLSFDEVAARSGTDKSQLGRLENGRVPDPRPSTLSRFALAIGKRLAWSLEDIK